MNDTKDRIAALLQDQSNDPPELVYHFTNTEALHSILFQDNEGDAFVLKADQFLTHLYNGYSRNPQQPLKDVLDWAYEQSGLERYIKNKIEGQIMHIDRCPKTHLCLRATEHVYKNDPTEFDYFRNLLINFISKEQSHNTEKINNFLNNYCNMNNSRAFFVSFSDVDFDDSYDDFPLWKYYTNGGMGFAIGLSAKAILDTLQNNDNDSITQNARCFSLQNVIYDYQTQSKLLKEFLKYVEHAMENNIPENSDLAEEIINVFIRISTCMKHPAYKDEREWRIAGVYGDCPFIDRDALYAIPKQGGLLLYSPILFYAKDTLKKIYAGPLTDKRMLSSLNFYLNKTYNISGFKAEHRKIPFKKL